MTRHASDRRRRPTRAAVTWRRQLLNDLGGERGLSAQERMILDLAVETKSILDSIDGWLHKQPTLIDPRRRALLPVVLQRQQVADVLARYLHTLGLKRRPQAPSNGKGTTPQEVFLKALYSGQIRKRLGEMTEEEFDRLYEQCWGSSQTSPRPPDRP